MRPALRPVRLPGEHPARLIRKGDAVEPDALDPAAPQRRRTVLRLYLSEARLTGGLQRRLLFHALELDNEPAFPVAAFYQDIAPARFTRSFPLVLSQNARGCAPGSVSSFFA